MVRTKISMSLNWQYYICQIALYLSDYEKTLSIRMYKLNPLCVISKIYNKTSIEHLICMHPTSMECTQLRLALQN